MRKIVALFLVVCSMGVCSLGVGGTVEKADHVVVIKSKKTLTLYHGDRKLATYPVVFGGRPVGHKRREGDKRTPEGHYILDFKKPDSDFYKAIHISYPNAEDIANARRRGVAPGGAIMIHGQRNYLGKAWFITRKFNWTDGCVALSNPDMEAVWQAVEEGTPIEIKP
jgi:murein L,D-transpeptidase YafK